MKIIFLGTNGWYTSATGNTACVLIDSKDHYVVLDAGNGIYKLDKYITEDKPVSLFISHFHIDHVSGLHTLDKFNFSKGLDVYFGEGRSKDFNTLVNPPFTIGIKKEGDPEYSQRMSVRLHELSKISSPFSAEAIEQHHAFRDHGYRIVLEGKTIAYSGDCGISPSSKKLAQDADLLIHECSFEADHAPNTWGHVGPVEAANLAKEANVKKLILTHFDASKYTTLEKRKEAEKIAQSIFPNTIAAVDDLIVEL
jgi:ribonuclease Z